MGTTALDHRQGAVRGHHWDWASAWDPAVDAACLAWHGWPAVRAAVDPETYQRAQVWWPTFAIEHIVAGWLRPSGTTGPDRAAGVVERAAEWLDGAVTPGKAPPAPDAGKGRTWTSCPAAGLRLTPSNAA